MMHVARTTTILVASCMAAIMVLDGCKVGPDYARPSVPTPDGWRERVRTDTSIGTEPYWRVYDDPILQGYVRQALDSNLDLVAAVARIDAARAQITIANADLYPQLGVDASASGFRNSENRYPGIGSDAFLGPSGVFGLLGTLSWELDIFGRIRRGTEAQRAQYRATEEAYRAARVSLVSAVAETYIMLRRLDLLKEIIDSNLASRRQYERLARTLFEGGKTSELDWRQAEGELRRVESELPVVVFGIAQTENALNVLLGRPSGMAIERGKPLTQQSFPSTLPSGLPSDLLVRRPDVVAAEQRLIAANARVGQAVAAMFPRFAINATGGFQTLDGAPVFDANSLMWNAAGNVVQPLFQGGRLSAQVDVADASTMELVAAYRQTILQATREVNDALVEVNQRRLEVEATVGGVRSNKDVLRLSELRYRYGATPYLQVLDAQRSLLDAQRREVEARAALYGAYINLYKALGGGWR